MRRLPALLLLCSGSASAHWQPAVDVNNHYVKITAGPDAVRVAFTVFFGERPGAAERRRMDRDHDGKLSPSEARTFGVDLMRTVVPAVEILLDGAPPAAGWQVSDVGLGTPVVAASAFSVDLVLVAPLPEPERARAHVVRVVDGWVPPSPGETEVRVEEAPGARLVASYLEGEPIGTQRSFQFVDHARRGFEVRFVVDTPPPPGQATPTKAEEPPPPPPRRDHSTIVVVVLVVLLGLGAVGIYAQRRRQR